MKRPARFQRAHLYPEDWNQTIQDFLELFQFHRYHYIYRPYDGDSWLSAKEQWRLTDTEILKAVGCVHPKFLLGFRFGKQTRFAVIDIDAGSEYHNLRSYKKLKNVLAAAGIEKVLPYRSSDGGGWHVYIFFEECVNSAHLRASLLKLLRYTQFRISPGTLEVFPNVSEGSAGMGLRLPLQPGFAWLNEETLETAIERWEVSPARAIDFFMDGALASANSYKNFLSLRAYAQELEQRSQSEKATPAPAAKNNVVPLRRLPVPESGDFLSEVTAIFQQLPPGIRADDWYRGRHYHAAGLTGPSQRADAIHCLSHYLFYGDPSIGLPALGYGYEDEREAAIHDILRLKHNGFSRDLNRGHRDAIAQVERAAHWRPPARRQEEPKKYKPQRPTAWVRENANRKLDARKRIQTALQSLKSLGRSFTTVELQEAAACSRRTLYNHADIWRQDYEDLASGFFAICTNEYNGVVGGGSSETAALPPPFAEIMPPGRLAARRIAYELSMRGEREKKAKVEVARSLRQRFSDEWQDEVTAATDFDLGDLDIVQLNAKLSILLAVLWRAPSEDEEKRLQTLIHLLRNRVEHLKCAKDPPQDRSIQGERLADQ